MHKNVSFLSWNCWKYVDNKRKRRGRDSRPLPSQAQRLQRMQTPSSNGKPRVWEAELGTSHCFFRRVLRLKMQCKGRVWRLHGFVMWPFLEDLVSVVYGDRTFPKHVNSLLSWMFPFFIMTQHYSCWDVPGPKVKVLFLTPPVLRIKVFEQSWLSSLMSFSYRWISSHVHGTLTFIKLLCDRSRLICKVLFRWVEIVRKACFDLT